MAVTVKKECYSVFRCYSVICCSPGIIPYCFRLLCCGVVSGCDHKQILIIYVWLLPGYMLPVVIALLVVGCVVLVAAGCWLWLRPGYGCGGCWLCEAAAACLFQGHARQRAKSENEKAKNKK